MVRMLVFRMDQPTSSDGTIKMICVICGEPVALETANTDDNGHAVHAQCYAQKMAFDGEPKTYPQAA